MTTSNAEKTTAKAKLAKLKPMPAALGSVTIPEAVAEFQRLDEQAHLVPQASEDDLLEILNTITEAASRLGINRADQLVTDHSSLLSTFTGVQGITQFHDSATADSLHRFRNVMLAVVAAASSSFNADPGGLYQRMPALKKRSFSHRRPLTDDEITLLRTMVHIESQADPGQVRPVIYALVDAGMTPGETTHFSLGDIVGEPSEIAMVLAAGNHQIEPRFLPLDPFIAGVVGRHATLAHEEATDSSTTLTYSGRVNVPGSPQATASSQRVIDRLLTQAGLAHGDVTATSIRLWRLATVYRAYGAAAAQDRAGYGADKDDLERLWRTLGCYAPHDAKPVADDTNVSFAD